MGCFIPLFLVFLYSYRQRVTVDVVDAGVVLCCVMFPEEGGGVDEAGRSLHPLDGHRVHKLTLGHCTLIYVGSL